MWLLRLQKQLLPIQAQQFHLLMQLFPLAGATRQWIPTRETERVERVETECLPTRRRRNLPSVWSQEYIFCEYIVNVPICTPQLAFITLSISPIDLRPKVMPCPYTDASAALDWLTPALEKDLKESKMWPIRLRQHKHQETLRLLHESSDHMN